MNDHLKRLLSLIMSLTMLLTVMSPVAHADSTGDMSGHFTTANSPPTITAVALYDATDQAATAMDPVTEYYVKVTVSDANTLNDLSTVQVTLFYDGDGAYAAQDVPGTSDTQTAAILTWTNGGSPAWSISPDTGTTWELVSTACVTPTLTASSGDFEFHFKPGKVARETLEISRWHIYAKADDGGETPGDGYQDNRTMNWYGEISTPDPSSVDWGVVAPGTDFGASTIQGPISVIYIANGAYDEQVKSDATWAGSPSGTATLNAGGTPGSNEFSLKADDTAGLDSAVLVNASGIAIDNSGEITSESGDTVDANRLWLKLGSPFTDATYNGYILFIITNGESEGGGGGEGEGEGGEVLYVAPGGNCGGATPCYGTPQAAVDAATGTTIKIAAGTYSGINTYGGHSQVLYVNKNVTIRGGYTTSNWSVSDPEANPTILDAQAQGRVIYVDAASPTIEGLHITGGSFGTSGGGVYLFESPAILRNNHITSNTADDGGGLYLNFSDARLYNNTIENNTADSGGGGLYLDGGALLLSNNIISGNTANWSAGGLYVSYADGTVINSTSIISNTALGEGGGLYVESTAITLTANVISYNYADYGGGGLYLANGGRPATLINNFVTDNRIGTDSPGSGVYLYNVTLHMKHNTIARNSGGDGYGIKSDGYCTAALYNTIIAEHTVGVLTSGYDNSLTLEGTLWYSNGQDISGSGISTGSVNVYGDPAFVDPDAGDYHIQLTSLAAGAGVDAGVLTDVDGGTRPQGSGIDIGADEIAE